MIDKVAMAERNRLIVEDLKSGMSIKDAAAKHQVSKYICYRVFREANCKEHSMNFHKWKKQRDKEIARKYSKGVTAVELAKEYNMNRATIYSVIKQVDPNYTCQRDSDVMTKAKKERLKREERYLQAVRENPQKSIQSLAKEYGFCTTCGYDIMHKAGIRRKSGRKKIKKAAKEQ